MWWRSTSLGAPDARQEPNYESGGIAGEIRRIPLASASQKEIHYSTTKTAAFSCAQITFPEDMLEKIEARMREYPGLTNNEVEFILNYVV
jgi:hypothetical protein